MLVRELIDALKDFDENVEVRMMHQPNYPLSSTIAGIYYSGDSTEDEEEEDTEDTEHVVWILEGTPLGYGIKKAWRNV